MLVLAVGPAWAGAGRALEANSRRVRRLTTSGATRGNNTLDLLSHSDMASFSGNGVAAVDDSGSEANSTRRDLGAEEVMELTPLDHAGLALEAENEALDTDSTTSSRDLESWIEQYGPANGRARYLRRTLYCDSESDHEHGPGVLANLQFPLPNDSSTNSTYDRDEPRIEALPVCMPPQAPHVVTPTIYVHQSLYTGNPLFPLRPSPAGPLERPSTSGPILGSRPCLSAATGLIVRS